MFKLTTNKILGGGTLLVVTTWAVYAFVKFGHPMEKWGVFGDKFGALNTLFTGLASVGVVAALWHEREGAADREREHKELIAAMKAQTEASKQTSQIAVLLARIDALTKMTADESLPHDKRNSAREGCLHYSNLLSEMVGIK